MSPYNCYLCLRSVQNKTGDREGEINRSRVVLRGLDGEKSNEKSVPRFVEMSRLMAQDLWVEIWDSYAGLFYGLHWGSQARVVVS